MKIAAKADAIVGGDPTMLRWVRRNSAKVEAIYSQTECVRSIEVPCQECGRMVLLAPSGQRIALGDGENVVELDKSALMENRIATVGEVQRSEGAIPVICMWCMFALSPDGAEAIAVLDAQLAAAKQGLGEA